MLRAKKREREREVPKNKTISYNYNYIFNLVTYSNVSRLLNLCHEMAAVRSNKHSILSVRQQSFCCFNFCCRGKVSITLVQTICATLMPLCLNMYICMNVCMGNAFMHYNCSLLQPISVRIVVRTLHSLS